MLRYLFPFAPSAHRSAPKHDGSCAPDVRGGAGGIGSAQAAKPPSTGRAPRSDRGVALIMVTAVIAILIAVAVEFTHKERVNLQLAANARDELRAYYMARSGVELSRLLLSFQSQVDQIQIPGLEGLAGMLGGMEGMEGLAGAAGALGGGEGGGGGIGIRLWELIPLDSGLIQMFLGMAAAPPDDMAGIVDGPALTPFGDFSGGFRVEITDEESKVNINQLVGLDRQVRIALVQLMSLLQDPRYDFLFNETDRYGIRMTRPDTILAIRAYIDDSRTLSNLVIGEDGPEFVPGSGDATYNYQRFDPRYEPKNAPLDSLDELFMIAGIGDYFMAAFGDRLTVYSDKNSQLNVTPQNMMDLCLRLVIASEDPVQGAQLCDDEVLMTNLWDMIQMQRMMMPFIGMTPAAFRALLEGQGIPVDRFVWEGPNAVFGNTSRTFTVKATGQAGDVQKTLVAVIRMEGSPLGRLLHWKEM
jgi:general secretion pathway protein K